MSLKPEHHGELNKCNVSRARFAQLRREYAGDAAALHSIDIYDPQSEYAQKVRQYRDALKISDEAKQARLERWFQEHGYT